jgi:ATP-dependent Clp protease ATP-binding subunit ClpC
MMNGFNFTERLRKVLAMAREQAHVRHHRYVGTEHLLLGLVQEREGVAFAVLTNLRVDPDEVTRIVDRMVQTGRPGRDAAPDMPYTSPAKKVLELAMAEARELNHCYVDDAHLLLGLVREEKGIAAEVLTYEGMRLGAARTETLRFLGNELPQRPLRDAPANGGLVDITIEMRFADGSSARGTFQQAATAIDFLERH